MEEIPARFVSWMSAAGIKCIAIMQESVCIRISHITLVYCMRDLVICSVGFLLMFLNSILVDWTVYLGQSLF